MLYNINEEVTTSTSQTYINPGISENIELSHRVATSPNGNAFIEYTYTNEAGQKVIRTEWEVNELPQFNDMTPGQQDMVSKRAEENKISTEEARKLITEGSVKAQMKRIINVAKLFVPEDDLKGQSFKSYLDFITFVSNKIGTSCKDVKLRVKFVYDRKGFVNTPEYVSGSNIWIERADKVAKEDSTIEVLATDKMQRDAVNGSRAPRTENPLEDSPSTTTQLDNSKTEKEDLPF